ncbi:MAG: DNA-directed RNA polymerase subunit beta, partial [Candidatus Pacebacteria bacterium]|nr:DNA-directed RNA polymerase subunit beta [Candidatus Paceibacterota bacterium]
MPSFLPTKIFSRYNRASLEVPDLTKFQKDSFNWFINQGIREVFNELTPIFDYTGREMKLEFLDYQLGEPKFSEEQAKEKEQNFEAPFRVKLRLTNLVEGIEREQEAYLGEIPILTPRSTFIINGIEKVVISQISRSPGVYFDFVNYHGRKLFGAKIIPYRGAWLELESDSDGAIGVKIDKKRKIAITALLKIFGLETNEDIKKIFDSEHEEKYIAATFKKDPAELREEAYIEICKRLRPGELPTFDSARDLINNMFFRLDRYDLSKIGRYKINQRLNLNTAITQRTLTLEDLISIVKEIIRLNEDFEAVGDDIDHLGNRRIKAVGESLLDRFRVGLMRMRRT